MRAFRICNFDQPPAIKTVPVPEPQPGQLRIASKACGLNFADLLMLKGTYQDTPPLPFTPGLEIAGRVDAVGPGGDKSWIGKRVAAFARGGGLAEYVCVDAEACTPLPDAITDEQAAGFQVAYGTSHLALDHLARLQPGETLLVTGAAGGVGLTAVEIGKKMGARVIACARGAQKLAVAQQAGADILLDSDTDDLRATVKKLGGADVLYETVGGDVFTAAFRACNPGARVLPIGFAGGTVPQIPANHILVKNISVIGLYWGGYAKLFPQVVATSLAQLLDWIADGTLTPHIGHTFPLDQTPEALDLLRSRKSTGKVVVVI